MGVRRSPEHWGIKVRLKGERLKERLDRLTGEIVYWKGKADEHWMDWLDAVREAGKRLIEVFDRFGHRSKWGKWRKRELIDKKIMSKETSLDYMTVARNWEQVQNARDAGFKIDSIRAVMRLLNGEDPAKLPGPKPTDADFFKQWTRKEFAKKLNGLKDQKQVRRLHHRLSNGLWDKVIYPEISGEPNRYTLQQLKHFWTRASRKQKDKFLKWLKFYESFGLTRVRMQDEWKAEGKPKPFGEWAEKCKERDRKRPEFVASRERAQKRMIGKAR